MSEPRPSAEWHGLTEALLHLIEADCVEDVLARAASMMAFVIRADMVGVFTAEGDHILEENWCPGPPARGDSMGDLLRVLARDSAVTGVPFECTPTDRSGHTIRVQPLSGQGRVVGAVALAARGVVDPKPAAETRLDLLARIVAELVLWHWREAEQRAASEQQRRWFDQLDRQVRVLDRERQKFAAVVNQSGTYAFAVDPEFHIHWVNRTMSLQRPPRGTSGWSGRACRDACSTLASADGACARCPVSRALETNEAVHDELRGRVEDRSRTFYVTALPIRGVEGSPQEVLVMMQDLSDLEALRESEERHRTVTRAASDGIVTIDESGTILFVNDALEAMLGYAANELVGQPLTRIMPPAMAERHRGAFQAYLGTGEKRMSWQGVQLPAAHRDGHEIPVEMSFGEFVQDGKRLFTGVIRDVTERRRAESELERTQERLSQSEKMEALGRLAGGVANDFNNLLTTVLGHSTLLLSQHDAQGETRRCLEEIKRAAERAATLTRQLVAFSRHAVESEPGEGARLTAQGSIASVEPFAPTSPGATRAETEESTDDGERQRAA